MPRKKKGPPPASVDALWERLERSHFIEPAGEQYERQLADWEEQLAPVREFIEQQKRAQEAVIGIADKFDPKAEGKPKKPRAKKSASKKAPNDRERIFLQCLELEGEALFRELDNLNLPIRKKWLKEGCPKTHLDIYKKRSRGPWCHRIQREKSKVKRNRDRLLA